MSQIFDDGHISAYTSDAGSRPWAVVENWLKQGMPVDAISVNGKTALFCAAEEGKIATVRNLLKNGAQINRAVKPVGLTSGGSALSAAASRAQHKVIKLLLDNGGDPRVLNKELNTAAHCLIRAWRLGSFSQRQDIQGEPTNTDSFIESLGLVLKAGVPIDQMNMSKETLLSMAVSDDVPLGFVELLLKSGADPDVRLGSGCTSLHMAASSGNVPAVELLVSHGANVNATDHQGRTALFGFFQAEVGQKLLDLGANLNHREIHGMDPLSFWIEAPSLTSGVSSQVSFLLAQDVDLSSKDYSGRTALDIAREKGLSEVVALITSKLARQTLRDVATRSRAAPK